MTREDDLDAAAGAAGTGFSQEDIDRQADQVIRDIEATSSFALRRGPDAEVFDPADIHLDEPEAPLPDRAVVEEFAGTEAVDELSETIEVVEPEQEDVREHKVEEDRAEAIWRHRRRLRTALIVVVVILLLIAAVILVFVWRGSLAPDVAQSDTEALTNSSAGTGSVSFEPVENSAIPNLAGVFGMTLKQAGQSCGDALVLDATPQKASDTRVKALQKLVSGQVLDANGEKVADVALGLNKKNKVVYAYCSFDLDALQVADAPFDEFAASDVVPRSLLSALGVDAASLGSPQISDGAASGATAGQQAVQSAVFAGQTGQEAPASWQVTETYDQSVGQTLGDNSVMRTLLIELY